MKTPDYSALADQSNNNLPLSDEGEDITQALNDRLTLIKEQIEELDILIVQNQAHFRLYGSIKTIDKIRALQDQLGNVNAVYYDLVKTKILAQTI